jgi:hypothetical protein
MEEIYLYPKISISGVTFARIGHKYWFPGLFAGK